MSDEDGEKPASRDSRVDMGIPESFHRVKRTLLVLCSILILLAVSKPATPGDAQLNMQLLSLHVPMSVARGLLWLAALYYAIGLWLEADTARRVNTHLFDGGMASFQDALTTVANRINRKVHAIDRFMDMSSEATGLVAWCRTTQADFDRADAHKILQSKLASASPEAIPAAHQRAYISSLLGEVISESSKNYPGPLSEKAKAVLERVEAALEKQTSIVSILEQEVRRASSDLTKLSKKIAGSRRASFWFWEIAVGLGLFVIASVMTLLAQLGAVPTS